VSDLWARAGDIFIERSNTPDLVGTAAMYSGADKYAIFPDLVIRARVDMSIAEPRFVEYCLRSPAGRAYFIEHAQGTAGSMPKIDQSTVEGFPLNIPSITEQKEIVSRLDAILRIEQLVEKRVARIVGRAHSLRESVLSKAFGGELVPTEAELAHAEGRSCETAGELLARVRSTDRLAASDRTGRRGHRGQRRARAAGEAPKA
jgi:type I restriction enzyme S subunit